MTAVEKKIKIKEKRAGAVKQKIDLLKTRDGSTAPPIESMNATDDFNLTMLFGFSMDENIDWNNPGIDGLMRIYYHIIQKLNGTIRDNNITNTDLSSTVNSSLQFAVDSIFNGTAYNSGFFIGNDSSNQDIKNRANRGEYDLSGSSLNSNIITAGNDVNNIIDKINDAITLIGLRSPLGVKSFPTVYNSILGKRFKDIKPQHSVENPPGSGFYDTTYGNGVYDSASENNERDYYDNNLNDLLNGIKTICNELLTYINYSKSVNEDYFTNPKVIPGRDNGWNMQNAWINKLNNIIVTIDTYLSNIGSANRPTKDSMLDGILIELNDWLNWAGSTVAEINGLQGNTGDPMTMRGYRFLWVKSIIDVNDGSRTAVGGIAIAIENIEKTIISAEEGFGLFGIDRQPVPWAFTDAWIGGLSTADIVDIVQYSTPDPDPNSITFGEMITVGYVVAWDGAGHSTGYDIYKSLDWDGTSGTFNKILPAGNSYTVEEIDLNTGKVLAYYIDLDVNIEYGEKPYYKVVAYDTGGSGDYARIPSVSEEGTPKNIDDFSAIAGVSPYIGPSGPPPEQPGTPPPYLFKWTTLLKGSDANDSPNNTTYISEAEFDSVGSNLEVFLNGEIKTLGNAANQYQINGSNQIIFNSQLSNTDDISIIVYFGAAGGAGGWKPSVDTRADLPSIGNSNGDIRLVLNENALYMWDEDYSTWEPIQSSSSINFTHNQLSDMPDGEGINPDHDERYYTQTQVDGMMDRMDSQLEALESLLPEEPILLGGEFTVSIDTYSGYLSNGPFNFDTLEPHDYSLNLINSTNFYLTNKIDQQFGRADQGILRLYINGVEVDTFDLGGNFNENERVGYQSYPPLYGVNNKLEITEVGMYNNYSIYQKGIFKIHISSGDILVGENEIKLLHDIDSLNQYEASMILYYDDISEVATYNSKFIDETYLSSAKFLSGVRYYTFNDKLRFRYYVDKLFKNTYVEDRQLFIQGSNFGCDDVYDNWRGGNVTNNPTGSYMDYLAYTIELEIGTSDVITDETTKMIIKTKDPFHEYIDEDLPGNHVLVNTYNNKSDDLTEYFVDEDYRMPYDSNFDSVLNVYKGLWDSHRLLGGGELQVFSGKIIYPHINYTADYIPSQIANYSNRTGSRYYTRAFVDIGNPHNNGKIIISGYNLLDGNNKIYMKLPEQTGWLDLSKPYNEVDFYGRDGDGCLVSHNGEEFYWTSGTYSSANSGYMIILRVEMQNATVNPISYIKMDW
jgi:hypothetical protein